MRFIFKTDYAQDIALVKHGGQAFWYGLLMLAMMAAPLWAGEYWLSQISFVLIYAVAGLGLMVLAGFTGLASIGHAAFLGVGAYVETVLTAKGWPFPLSFAVAGAENARGLPAAEIWSRAGAAERSRGSKAAKFSGVSGGSFLASASGKSGDAFARPSVSVTSRRSARSLASTKLV